MILCSSNKKLQLSSLSGVKSKIGKKVTNNLPPKKVTKSGKIQEKIKLFENLAQNENSDMSPMIQTYAPRPNQSKPADCTAAKSKIRQNPM